MNTLQGTGGDWEYERNRLTSRNMVVVVRTAVFDALVALADDIAAMTDRDAIAAVTGQNLTERPTAAVKNNGPAPSAAPVMDWRTGDFRTEIQPRHDLVYSWAPDLSAVMEDVHRIGLDTSRSLTNADTPESVTAVRDEIVGQVREVAARLKTAARNHHPIPVVEAVAAEVDSITWTGELGHITVTCPQCQSAGGWRIWTHPNRKSGLQEAGLECLVCEFAGKHPLVYPDYVRARAGRIDDGTDTETPALEQTIGWQPHHQTCDDFIPACESTVWSPMRWEPIDRDRHTRIPAEAVAYMTLAEVKNARIEVPTREERELEEARLDDTIADLQPGQVLDASAAGSAGPLQHEYDFDFETDDLPQWSPTTPVERAAGVAVAHALAEQLHRIDTLAPTATRVTLPSMTMLVQDIRATHQVPEGSMWRIQHYLKCALRAAKRRVAAAEAANAGEEFTAAVNELAQRMRTMHQRLLDGSDATAVP